MTHYDRRAWRDYVLDGPVEREAMDRHLAECDACLAVYAEWIEELADRLPDIADPDGLWASGTLPAFPPEAAPAAKERPHADKARGRRSLTSQRWFHYAVAACLTLALTSSGLFAQVLRQTTALTERISIQDDAGLTKAIMAETSSWIRVLTSGKKG